MRRIFYKMDSSESSIPAMIASFDFSSLGPVLAEDLNPDAFEDEGCLSSDYYSCGSEQGDGDFEFEALNPKSVSTEPELDLVDLFELPFAMEEFKSGVKAQYLPTLADRSGRQFAGANEKLLLNGKLMGVLESWVEVKGSTNRLERVKTLLLAAITGGRDIKPDALVGSTLIDIEESMAAEVKGSKLPKPSVHLPALDDPIAQQILTTEEVKALIALVRSWDVADLLSYTRRQKHAFRMNEIEDLELSENPEEPVMHKVAAHGLTFMLEESMREEEFFPRIPSGKDHLYAKRQVKAFKARLERIQEALIELDSCEESQWPEVNLWGLVNIVDPQYGEFCNIATKARQNALSGISTGLRPLEERFLLVDSAEKHFVGALAQHAGRTTLRASNRVRAASASEVVTQDSGRAASPLPLTRSASANANLLSDRKFKFITASHITRN